MKLLRSAVRQFSILHFFRSSMNLLPSAVHVSSTFKSEAPRSYCVALFANTPFSIFFSEPHEFIALCYSCVLHHRVWSPAKLLRSAVRQFSILHFIRSSMNLLPSTIHASSTIQSGAPRSYCVALFANSPFSTFFSEPHEFIA